MRAGLSRIRRGVVGAGRPEVVSRGIQRQIRTAAKGRCEYCRMPAMYDTAAFHIDHVIARQHGGLTVRSNLAFCCAYCNANKGPNIASIDPRTRRLVRLFHPRMDRWSDHFAWRGARLKGLTGCGRATVALLRINDPVNVTLRESLLAEGVF